MNPYSYKKILVPVDLSESSLNALETAASLAVRKKARLFILHVEDDSLDFLPNEKTGFQMEELSSDVVTALANAIQHKAELKPVVIRKQGAVTPMILKTASENDCDLIVMGTHGASGYRDCFIGTNTYNVIKYASSPVLSVPPNRKFTTFRKVLFPVRPVTGALVRYDVVKHFLSQDSQLNILGLSYRRQEREQNTLEEITMEISARIKEDRIIAKTAWGNGNGISEDVISYAGQYHPDLLVVTSSLDVTNKPHFVGPNAQKIINYSKVPVLSIRKIALPLVLNN